MSKLPSFTQTKHQILVYPEHWEQGHIIIYPSEPQNCQQLLHFLHILIVATLFVTRIIIYVGILHISMSLNMYIYFLFKDCKVAVQYLKIEHDFNGITTTSTRFKGFFNFLLREPKPVSYKGFHIDFATPQKLKAKRPCVLIAEDANHINFPVFCMIKPSLFNTTWMKKN